VRIDKETRRLIDSALREDLGSRGDVTTKYFLSERKIYRARFLFKESGILCGRSVVDAVFKRAAPKARLTWKYKEGRRVPAGAAALLIRGPREIMTAERTALNFLQKLCGIATAARAYADAAKGTRTRIYDTRKTLPGWRALSKYAVRTGGGVNHRMGLFDMAMLKDNHLDGLKQSESRALVARFRKRCPGVSVEVEARNRREIDAALHMRADVVMLDNMTPAVMKKEIARLRRISPKTQIEISGGVDLRSIKTLAKLGADRISVGRITHSAAALDISMKLERP